MVIYDFGDFKFSDSTTGENTTTGCVNRLFVTFCDMSQKAIDTTGSGPRSCGVCDVALFIQVALAMPTLLAKDNRVLRQRISTCIALLGILLQCDCAESAREPSGIEQRDECLHVNRVGGLFSCPSPPVDRASYRE